MTTTNKSDSLQRPKGRGFSPTLLITQKGQEIFKAEAKPKAFKSGKKGYYAGIMVVVNGKVHRGNFMIYEVG
jgi:hypothetical protein